MAALDYLRYVYTNLLEESRARGKRKPPTEDEEDSPE
jgi:hypothetical protein